MPIWVEVFIHGIHITAVKSLVRWATGNRWATGKRLINRLPKLSLIKS